MSNNYPDLNEPTIYTKLIDPAVFALLFGIVPSEEDVEITKLVLKEMLRQSAKIERPERNIDPDI